jgi:hypothetical protein
MANRKVGYWVIRPQADTDYVASMEQVLQTYAIPSDGPRPVLCTDEQPVQLIKESRTPIEATMRHPQVTQLRIRAGMYSEYLHVHGTSIGMANGDSVRIENKN